MKKWMRKIGNRFGVICSWSDLGRVRNVPWSGYTLHFFASSSSLSATNGKMSGLIGMKSIPMKFGNETRGAS